MTNFQRSYEVNQLVERLSKLAVGEQLTYEDAAALVGQDRDGERFRAMLTSARRIVQSDKLIVFGTVPTVGLERLDGVAIVKTGATSIAKIRRESQRGLRRLACVKYEELSQADRAKHDAAASHLGVLTEFSKASTVKKMTAAAETKVAKLNVEETLDAFRK